MCMHFVHTMCGRHYNAHVLFLKLPTAWIHCHMKRCISAMEWFRENILTSVTGWVRDMVFRTNRTTKLLVYKTSVSLQWYRSSCLNSLPPASFVNTFGIHFHPKTSSVLYSLHFLQWRYSSPSHPSIQPFTSSWMRSRQSLAAYCYYMDLCVSNCINTVLPI